MIHTMVEKSSKHLELCSKLYDHATYNGSNYLNSHFPVYQDGKILYLSVPVGSQLWDNELSWRLGLGPERQVILL